MVCNWSCIINTFQRKEVWLKHTIITMIIFCLISSDCFDILMLYQAKRTRKMQKQDEKFYKHFEHLVCISLS